MIKKIRPHIKGKTESLHVTRIVSQSLSSEINSISEDVLKVLNRKKLRQPFHHDSDHSHINEGLWGSGNRS